jgi:MYXO-CTERM domain-containing protein
MAAAAVAGGTFNCKGGFSRVMAPIVVGDNKDRFIIPSVEDDDDPPPVIDDDALLLLLVLLLLLLLPAFRLLILLLVAFPRCCSLRNVSSIPTYCNPFWRKETSAPGGIDLSAFLMLDLPSIDSYTKVKEE